MKTILKAVILIGGFLSVFGLVKADIVYSNSSSHWVEIDFMELDSDSWWGIWQDYDEVSRDDYVLLAPGDYFEKDDSMGIITYYETQMDGNVWEEDDEWGITYYLLNVIEFDP